MKKFNRKRKTGVKRPRRHRKVKKPQNTITFINKQLLPFPVRYRCRLHTSIYGNYAAGFTTGQTYVHMNRAYLPFAGGAWANPSQSLATLNPTGYSSLGNVHMYNGVRVLKARCDIEFLPLSVLDSIIVTITPSLTTNNPADPNVGMTQPFKKTVLFSSDKVNGKRNMLSLSGTQHKFAGCAKKAIDYDLSYQYCHIYNGSPATPIYYVCNFQTPSLVNTAQQMDYRVDLIQDVEFFNMVQAEMIQT